MVLKTETVHSINVSLYVLFFIFNIFSISPAEWAAGLDYDSDCPLVDPFNIKQFLVTPDKLLLTNKQRQIFTGTKYLDKN